MADNFPYIGDDFNFLPLDPTSRDSRTEEIRNSRQIIILNVGGMVFRVLTSNFALLPRTRLAKLVRARNEVEILELCDGYAKGKSENERERERELFQSDTCRPKKMK